MDDAELKRLAEAVEVAQEVCARLPSSCAVTRNARHQTLLKALFAFDRAANPATILRLLRERDELAVELMDNSISAAAVAIQLRRERDEARAAVERVRDVACAVVYIDDLPLPNSVSAAEVLAALDADQGEGEGA